MRVLVTGGAGFVGRHLVRRLIDRGDSVTVADTLLLEPKDTPIHETLRKIAAGRTKMGLYATDVTDPKSVDDLFARFKFDQVYHLAAESHVDKSIAHPRLAVETNVIGTQVVAMACVKHGARMLYCSTDEVYGDTCVAYRRLNDEGDPPAPSSPYSAGKAAGELIVRAMCRTFGLKAVITRACNAFGPEQFHEKLIPIAVSLLKQGKPVPLHGGGSQIRQWIHVDEFVSGMICAMENGLPEHARSRTYNLAGPCRVSVKELVMALAAIIDPTTKPHGTMLVNVPAMISTVCTEDVGDRPGQDAAYGIVGERATAIGFTAKRKITDEVELRALISAYGPGAVQLATY